MKGTNFLLTNFLMTFLLKNCSHIEQQMRFWGCLVSLIPFLANSCDVHHHFELLSFPRNTIKLDIGPITTLNSRGLLSP